VAAEVIGVGLCADGGGRAQRQGGDQELSVRMRGSARALPRAGVPRDPPPLAGVAAHLDPGL
jgi:hypothetical protein